MGRWGVGSGVVNVYLIVVIFLAVDMINFYSDKDLFYFYCIDALIGLEK